MSAGSYSATTDEQLDALEQSDPALYDQVLEACELIFRLPGSAQSLSSAVTTEGGIVLRLPIAGNDMKIFWRSDGPRIEAVFPYPT